MAIVCAGVAGVIACAAMQAQRHGRQVLLEEEQAADRWNFYLAKLTKANLLEAKMEMIRVMGSKPHDVDVTKAAEYRSDLKQLFEDANHLEFSAAKHSEYNQLYLRVSGFYYVCVLVSVIAVFLHQMALLNRTGHGLEQAIAERHELERKFLQAQKLEALGRLAAGVAHDFNNLLMVISAYTEGLFDAKDSHPTAAADSVKHIREASLKGAALTRQLMDFTRKLPPSKQLININSVIESVFGMLRRLLGSNIEMVTHLDPDAGWLEADENQISQVIINLCLNGRHAMLLQSAGTLTLSTRKCVTALGKPENTPESSSGWVCVEVADTGSGMTAETLDQAFEPFFTTKELGKGTGLGMSTCFHIVCEHRGKIHLDTELGKGTKVSVFFPRSTHRDEPIPPSSTELISPIGKEIILLVDSAPEVRKLGAMLLRELGYPVFEAGDATAAQALLDSSVDDRPELIICDLKMPAMGGYELARKASDRFPEIPILFTARYGEEPARLVPKIRNSTALLEKPYSGRSLAETVRKILDAPRTIGPTT